MPLSRVIIDLRTILKVFSTQNHLQENSITGTICGYVHDGEAHTGAAWPIASRYKLSDDTEKLLRDIEKTNARASAINNLSKNDPQNIGVYITSPRILNEVENLQKDKELFNLLYHFALSVCPDFFLLVYRVQLEELGCFPFQAWQLSTHYIKLRQQLETEQITQEQFKKQLFDEPALVEIPCIIEDSLDAKAIMLYCKPTIEEILQRESIVNNHIIHHRYETMADYTALLENIADQEKKPSRPQRRAD